MPMAAALGRAPVPSTLVVGTPSRRRGRPLQGISRRLWRAGPAAVAAGGCRASGGDGGIGAQLLGDAYRLLPRAQQPDLLLSHHIQRDVLEHLRGAWGRDTGRRWAGRAGGQGNKTGQARSKRAGGASQGCAPRLLRLRCPAARVPCRGSARRATGRPPARRQHSPAPSPAGSSRRRQAPGGDQPGAAGWRAWAQGEGGERSTSAGVPTACTLPCALPRPRSRGPAPARAAQRRPASHPASQPQPHLWEDASADVDAAAGQAAERHVSRLGPHDGQKHVQRLHCREGAGRWVGRRAGSGGCGGVSQGRRWRWQQRQDGSQRDGQQGWQQQQQVDMACHRMSLPQRGAESGARSGSRLAATSAAACATPPPRHTHTHKHLPPHPPATGSLLSRAAMVTSAGVTCLLRSMRSCGEERRKERGKDEGREGAHAWARVCDMACAAATALASPAAPPPNTHTHAPHPPTCGYCEGSSERKNS